jgi:hypothetical protein
MAEDPIGTQLCEEITGDWKFVAIVENVGKFFYKMQTVSTFNCFCAIQKCYLLSLYHLILHSFYFGRDKEMRASVYLIDKCSFVGNILFN